MKDTQNNKNILFIQIPKTAGTSINHVLSSNSKNLWNRNKNFNYHDPYFLLQKNNPSLFLMNCFIFSVVRNPFTRAFSCFKFFNYINDKNFSFDEFLMLCKNRKNEGDGEINFWKTPMIFYPQTLFLYDLNGNLKKDNIYKFENLLPLEKRISKILGKDIKFPVLNINKKVGYYESYTLENIKTVQDIFSIDFENFNYSANFK